MKVIKFNIIKGDREKMYPVKVTDTIFDFLQLSIPPLHSYDMLGRELISDIDDLRFGLNIYKSEVVHKVLKEALGIDKSDVRYPADFYGANVMQGADDITINIEIE